MHGMPGAEPETHVTVSDFPTLSHRSITVSDRLDAGKTAVGQVAAAIRRGV